MIPNTDQAVIDPAKLRDYLLSLSHPVGRYKAATFLSMGYSQAGWQLLEADLREQHLSRHAVHAGDNRFGRIYEILGDLTGPSGKIVCIKSIWIILMGQDYPRFVTAYPG